jgi:GNAT superfamily N-acetyltransferase
MATTSVLDRSSETDADLRSAPLAPAAPAAPASRGWAIYRMQRADVAEVKALFRKLHAFNSALDPRFALSEEWEAHFDATIEEMLRGDESLGLIAREMGTGRACGFALAAVHHDSGMWRYHEWVEVEALYVEDTWRGSGLADALLARACGWADSVGQPVVQLYVTASNDRAIRFYEHEGFHETQAIMRKVLA